MAYVYFTTGFGGELALGDLVHQIEFNCFDFLVDSNVCSVPISRKCIQS